jgi:hypothetical protein
MSDGDGLPWEVGAILKARQGGIIVYVGFVKLTVSQFSLLHGGAVEPATRMTYFCKPWKKSYIMRRRWNLILRHLRRQNSVSHITPSFDVVIMSSLTIPWSWYATIINQVHNWV